VKLAIDLSVMAQNSAQPSPEPIPDSPLGGRYKILRQLGAGGFGHTFLAEDLHLPGQPRCVVKQFKPQSTDTSSFTTARRLFDTEAKVLHQLGHHDQIPRLLAHFEDNQEFYLVQELIDGTPLNQQWRSGERWSEARVITLLTDLLQVLVFVHQQHVIHRDIKPSNLIYRHSDGKIVLIDFGAVKQVATPLTPVSPIKSALTIAIGTQGYMPREQLAGSPRFSSDIYAVGMVGIQLLTGIPPHRLSEDLETGEIHWRDRAPSINPVLADILDRMVRYDFRDRYPTATEALAALSNLNPGAVDLPVPLISPAVPDASEIVATQAPPTSASQFRPLTVPRRFSQRPTVVAPQALPQTVRKPIPIVGIAIVVGSSFLIGLISAIAFIPRSPRSQNTPNPSVTSSSSTTTPKPADSNANPQAAEQLQKAHDLRNAGRYLKALVAYNQTIALNPKLAAAHWGRCYTLNALKRTQAALVACNQAIALQPNYPEALWSKGYALDQLQRHEEALALYGQAIALKPDFAEAWSNRGTTLLILDRPAEAVTAFDKATALKPDFAEAWNNRGAALWELRQFDAAIASVETAIRLQPNYQNARNLRQQMRRQLGR
jgi:serine/threonine protein kinase